MNGLPAPRYTSCQLFCPVINIAMSNNFNYFITFSQYLAHINDLFIQLQILPFTKLVIHRIGLQMFQNYLGYILKAVESLFITNSDIHIYKYNTRNKDKMRSAYGKQLFMYSNFRFVGIHIWNYILDHLV